MNGERVLAQWQRVRTAAFTALLAGSFDELGRGARLVPPLRLVGAGAISVGAGTYIGAGAWLQTLDLGDGVPDVLLRIGAHCGSSGGLTVVAAQEVVIEDRVGMGRGVYIADHTHRTDGPGPIREQGVTGVAPVRICRGSWLGQGVVVLPGVTVGAGAVVGANSVVRDDVPPRTVAVGAPARVVKRLN